MKKTSPENLAHLKFEDYYENTGQSIPVVHLIHPEKNLSGEAPFKTRGAQGGTRGRPAARDRRAKRKQCRPVRAPPTKATRDAPGGHRPGDDQVPHRRLRDARDPRQPSEAPRGGSQEVDPTLLGPAHRAATVEDVHYLDRKTSDLHGISYFFCFTRDVLVRLINYI